MQGKLFIVSGQSGVGKNTILTKVLKQHPDYIKMTTCTNRSPRPEEIEGQDHYFISDAKFKSMIHNNEFIEYAQTHGNLYGTPKDRLKKFLSEGKIVLMEIDVKGVQQIKKQINPITIFIKYESDDIEPLIRKRLTNDPTRNDNSEEDIQTRIDTAKKESEFEKFYDYSVTNPEGDIEKAVREVEKIIKDNI